MVYNPTVFVNGQAPAYDSAEELNKVQQGIVDAHRLANKVVGSYTGTTTTYTDTTTWQTITLGFRPKAVYVDMSKILGLGEKSSYFRGLAVDGASGENIEILPTGFRVRQYLNAVGNPATFNFNTAEQVVVGPLKYIAFQ